VRIARHLNPQRVNRGVRAAQQGSQIGTAKGEIDSLLSPPERTPSRLVGAGTSLSAVASAGSVSARGIA
jgi:hypothetical protein